jgi:hypothetical protein
LFFIHEDGIQYRQSELEEDRHWERRGLREVRSRWEVGRKGKGQSLGVDIADFASLVCII